MAELLANEMRQGIPFVGVSRLASAERVGETDGKSSGRGPYGACDHERRPFGKETLPICRAYRYPGSPDPLQLAHPLDDDVGSSTAKEPTRTTRHNLGRKANETTGDERGPPDDEAELLRSRGRHNNDIFLGPLESVNRGYLTQIGCGAHGKVDPLKTGNEFRRRPEKSPPGEREFDSIEGGGVFRSVGGLSSCVNPPEGALMTRLVFQAHYGGLHDVHFLVFRA